MLSEETRNEIDSMSKADLRQEIDKKNRSRFQGEKYAYLQTRLATLEEQEQEARRTEDVRLRGKELILKSVGTWVAIATSVLSLLIGSGWYQEYQKNQRAQAEASERLVVEYLQPIATYLKDNESIFRELRAEPYSEPGWGILG